MYQYIWDRETHGYHLHPDLGGIIKPIRPVFYEELDLLGMNKYWVYPHCKEPLLWAEGARRYIFDGELVAETQGGGFFSEPSIRVYQKDLVLTPVNIEMMAQKNKVWLDGLSQKAMSFVYDTWKTYKKKVDVFYVAFSGGKDSMVLLDVVQRALSKEDFLVVFGDTQMEVDDTYHTVRETTEMYPELSFHSAKSDLSPAETWASFGPPSRRHRWCCSVHKSAPSLLLLRELTQKENMKAVAFDGVRAEESALRATYEPISTEGKHGTQINVSPLLDWNSAEIFAYIFSRSLLLNPAYRKGMVRVGCMVCPMASPWFEYLTTKLYSNDTQPYLKSITQYANAIDIAESKMNSYIEGGNWKARAGGKGIVKAGEKVDFSHKEEKLTLKIPKYKWSMFRAWLPSIGKLTPINEHTLSVFIPSNTKTMNVAVDSSGEEYEITFSPITNCSEDIVLGKYLKNLANKATYCVGCQACSVECAFGALSYENGKVMIDDTKCTHCLKCHSFVNGCLRAKSLYTTKGGNSMYKGLNRYQHFGYRQEWLQDYLAQGNDLFGTTYWGKYQYESMKVWFRESLIMGSNALLPFGEFVKRIGVENKFGWALMWINLSYNSSLMRWFVTNISPGAKVSKNEMLAMFGSMYAKDTIMNALTSLFETMEKSPIGNALGQGVCQREGRVVKDIYRKGWLDAEPLAILYALYQFAEHEEGRYSFTLEQLDNSEANDSGLTPQQIFAINTSMLRAIILGLSKEYPDYIQADMAMGLDNIRLSDAKSTQDVLELYHA